MGSQAAFLNCTGVRFVFDLKVLIKKATSLYPTSDAISFTFLFVPVKSRQELSILMSER